MSAYVNCLLSYIICDRLLNQQEMISKTFPIKIFPENQMSHFLVSITKPSVAQEFK